MAQQKKLNHVDPDTIHKNPENPRVIFREDELDALMRSIDQVGIQVPLSVYEKRGKYVLIDGERRWRCSKKLGLKSVPVIVEPEPSKLNNLLMMFNIHNVRIQWDLIALALKITKVRELVKKERSVELTKKEIADLTGVNTATIARCDDILSLPNKYQDIIWEELEKPKGDQKYTEDLFIEIKKSIRTIEKYLPEIITKYTSSHILDTFYKKYESGVENNRVKFRDISKIARGESLGVEKKNIVAKLNKYITDPKYTIEEAFDDSIGDAFNEKSTEKKMNDVINILVQTRNIGGDKELKDQLIKLKKEVDRLLK